MQISKAKIKNGIPIPSLSGREGAGRPRRFDFTQLSIGECAIFRFKDAPTLNEVSTIRSSASYQLGVGNYTSRTIGKKVMVWRTR